MRSETSRGCHLVSSGARWIMQICEVVRNNTVGTGRTCGKVESEYAPPPKGIKLEKYRKFKKLFQRANEVHL